MKRVYRIFIFVSFLCMFFLTDQALFAAEGIKIGEAKLNPYVETKLQYDDNVFLNSNDEKDDFIVTLTPGLSLEWPVYGNLFKFDYHAAINRFMDNTSQDATDHYLSTSLDINWQDATFTIHEDFKRVFERPSTEDVTRVKRDDNSAGIIAKLQRDKLGIELGYENFIRNYKSSPSYELYDRRDNIYSLMFTHQTFRKTRLLLEYYFAQIRYSEDTRSDSNYHQFLIGAIGELTPKTTATIKTGYQLRNYERDSEPDFDTAVLYADITHKFSGKNTVKLSFLRSAEESTYDVNNYYKIENLSWVFDHYFNNRLLGFITGIYQINSYPRESTEGIETAKRKDKYYSMGVGLRYYLKKWFTLTLHLEHIIRDSNFDIFEYKQNLITVTAKAEF